MFSKSLILLATLYYCANCKFSDRNYSTNLRRYNIIKETGKECTKPGYICDSCTEYSLCVQIGENEYLKVDMGMCPSGETCSESTGTCSSSPNAICDILDTDEYEFECTDKGYFPDPFNCKKYYICNITQLLSREDCPDGFGYDSRTTLCSIKLVGNTCQGKTNWCNSMGIFPIEGNSRMFYLCELKTINGTNYLFPKLYRCSRNYIFIDNNCFDPEKPYGLDNNGKCQKLGRLYLPNCGSYNTCIEVGKEPISSTCAAGSKFNINKKNCEPFECW